MFIHVMESFPLRNNPAHQPAVKHRRLAPGSLRAMLMLWGARVPGIQFADPKICIACIDASVLIMGQRSSRSTPTDNFVTSNRDGG